MVPLQGDDGRSGSLSARHSRGRHRGDLRSARANEHLNARVISTDHVPWPSGFLVGNNHSPRLPSHFPLRVRPYKYAGKDSEK